MMLILSYMFVFFFKQKTAYEMRISDWSSDVCSSDLRPEAGIIAQAEARPIAHAGKAGKAAGVKLSCVEEGDDAEIAEADTRLYGRFGRAAAADRIVVQVFGADRLIAIAADRAAATRVESARRRDVEKRRAADLAEAQTSGEDIVVRPERHIGGAVEIGRAHV